MAHDRLMNVYNRAPLRAARGLGARLWDEDGVEYLDCVQGISTNGLGHAHPKLIAALNAQAEKLWHASNIFRIPDQEALAEQLCQHSFADTVFFTSSGAEAVECALKTARRYQHQRGHPERVEIFGFDGAFHGRTYGAINAAANPDYVTGFGPPMPGFQQLPWGDRAAIDAALSSPTACALILEPIQGEGGCRSTPPEDLRWLRQTADAHGVLLIFDEVQCGMGRTGKLWAHEWADVTPDIMTIAKALGGGIPIGACLATAEAAAGMTVGAHGSTFGGNPLSMAVGLAAFAELANPALLDHVQSVSAQIRSGLETLGRQYPDVIVEVRGAGLLIGVKLVPNNREFVALARDDQRLLIAAGGDNCVRILPPLNITGEEAHEMVQRFEAICQIT